MGYLGYDESGFVNIKDHEVGAKLLDKLSRIKSDRRQKPIDQYNNIEYPHRQYYDNYNLLIGDTYFMIPPEFIAVTSEATTQSVVTLRQENTQKEKTGYHKRTVLIDLVFHGADQINGYKVKGPESPDKDYYVDGLRPLLAQFKCAPFLPIQNELINNTYGIMNVALQGITISTVGGYPSLLKAQLTLQEVNMFPYIEMPDVVFRHMIDWDLFRYYYQSFLTEEHEYKKLQSIPANKEYTHFRMSILDEKIFEQVSEDGQRDYSKNNQVNEYNILEIVTDKTILRHLDNGELAVSNYVTWIDSNLCDAVISEFQCGYSNLLTNIQMSDMSSPTLQFLGGMDTIFNISFETKDAQVVRNIEQCQMANDMMMRNNTKLRGSLGFIKLESELVQFTGTLYVMIENVTTNTVPGFPGLFSVQFTCVAYDIAQSKREELNGFRPFDCEKCDNEKNPFEPSHIHGDDQTIEQNETGLIRKIKQDIYAEWKLRITMEVYPDLCLPKYSEINKVIKKIRKFRKKNNLEEYQLKKYPLPPASLLHGCNPDNNIKVNAFVEDTDDSIVDLEQLDLSEAEYDVYADPDFYVFYPCSYVSFTQDVDKDIYNDISEVPYMEGYTKTHQEFHFPQYDETAANASGTDTETVGSASAEEFVQYALTFKGNKYVWGGTNPYTGADCSGFIQYCFKHIGVKDCPRTSGEQRSWDKTKKIPLTEIKRGDILGRKGHVGIYIGNNQILHASNSNPYPAGGIKISTYSEYQKSSKPFTDAHRYKGFENTTSNATSVTIATSKKKKENMSKIWNILRSMGFTEIATAGIMGNIEEECRYNSSLIEYGSKGQKKFSSSNKYTKAVDNGKYSRYDFAHDKSGYGLFQFTYYTHKEDLYDAAKKKGVSISDIELQLKVMRKQLGGLYGQLNNAKTVEEASYLFLTKYEKPADQGIKEQNQRNSAAKIAYNMFKGTVVNNSYSSNNNATNNGKILTVEQFNEICKVVAYNTDGEGDKAEKAFAQLIFDRLHYKEKSFGTLDNVLQALSDGMDGNDIELTDTLKENVKAIFTNGEKIFPKRQVLYSLSADIKNAALKAKRYDDRHIRLKSVGNHMFWGKKGKSKDIKYTIVIKAVPLDQLGNPIQAEVGTEAAITTEGHAVFTIEEHEVEHEAYMVENENLFGEPVIIKTRYYSDNSTKAGKMFKNKVNHDINSFNTSFCDMYHYSCRGRLVRAFPTYLFCILDDNAQWYDGKKLWTNYYTHRSVVDIAVHATNDMPTQTATLTVNNSYHNLSRAHAKAYDYTIKDDEGINKLVRDFYQFSNIILGVGPKLTSGLIQLHQIIYSKALLKEGARIHLRMGYGSDPMALAPVMNGHISDVALGDQVQIVVTSDAHELLQNVVSAKEKNSNNGWLGLFGLGERQESSNLIANVLCKRSSWVTYLAKNTFEMSKHGIEHFGLFMNQDIPWTAGLAIGGTILGGIIGTFAAPGAGTVAGALTGFKIGSGSGYLLDTAGVELDTYTSNSNNISVDNVGDFSQNPIGGVVGDVGGTSNAINVADLWDEWSEQYDILKNIYRANYKRVSYHYSWLMDGFGEGDEQNVVFNNYNMTPWDVCQISTQQVPEYIVKASYHQFDSRLYFGLPLWLEKFRYDIIDNDVYEECKSACQVHFLDSMDNIIDNQIKVTARYSSTNVKVMYIRGSNAVSTQTIHSDDTIDMSRQKTKIIDTPIVQDALGPDKLWEAFGYRVGENAARRVGISNLLYGWQQQYQGQILCMGCPGMKPDDYIMINDTFANLAGVAIVREVTHSFSTSTGFTTSIVPGMIGFSSDGNSGMIERTENYISVLSCFASYTSIRRKIKNNYEADIGLWGSLEQLRPMLEEHEKAMGAPGWMEAADDIAGTAYVAWGVGHTGYHIFKAAKALCKGKKFLEIVGAIGEGAKNTWNVLKAGGAAKTAIQFARAKGVLNVLRVLFSGTLSKEVWAAGAAGAGPTGGASLIAAAAINLCITLLTNTILHAIRTYFDNKNVCVLLPLYWENRHFVAGVKGGEKILLIDGDANATDENTRGDKTIKGEGSSEEDPRLEEGLGEY